MSALTPIADALGAALSPLAMPKPVAMPVTEALGKVLAEDILAPVALPTRPVALAEGFAAMETDALTALEAIRQDAVIGVGRIDEDRRVAPDHQLSRTMSCLRRRWRGGRLRLSVTGKNRDREGNDNRGKRGG